jgi:hypothetical protein
MKNTIKHIWTVICQKSSVDANSNILSLFEILEKININIDPKAPNYEEGKILGIPFNFEIISYWKKTTQQSSGEGKIIILSPEKKELNSFPLEIKIPESLNSMRLIIKMDGLKFTTSGEYKVEVQQKNGNKFDVVAEIPFEVTIHKQINS